jgi:hypothetical protein
MSVECSMLAISAERYAALRSNPSAVTDEVILRKALDHLAGMLLFKKHMAEAEVLAEIRANHRQLDMADDATMRRRMAERYAREDALVDAALARGDRQRPFNLGTNWRYLNETLAESERSAPLEHFIFSAPRFGEDVGYGPAGLHGLQAVAAFAAYLDPWSGERFAAVAAARRPPDLANRYRKQLPRGMSLAGLDAEMFLRFKTFILDAAAARAGMLIWMS